MEFLIGGIAACGAGIFTNPLEVVKTRLQLQGELQSRGVYTVHYKNAIHAFYVIAKADGILALQKGLIPALWYQLCMNGVRLGTYDTIQKLGYMSSSGEVSFPKSVLGGAISGCVGAFFGSPFYMIKTQLQAQSSSPVAVGYQHSHQTTSQAFKVIFMKHGPLGLWRGATASMARATCGSAAQLSTFSKSKSFIEGLELFTPGSWLNAFIASIFSGCILTIVMTPLDVMSTRLYNQGVDSKGHGLAYSGLLDCFKKMLYSEGLFGFYKGATASFLRSAPHTILSLTFWSELGKLYAYFNPTKEIII